VRHKDYYKILGVDRSASRDEIQDAFHTLARKYHPDVNPDPRVVERFKDISAAYEVLSDPRQKARYDRQSGTSRQHTAQAHGYPGDTTWRQQTTYNRRAGAKWYSDKRRTSAHIPPDELESIATLMRAIRIGGMLIVAILVINILADTIARIPGATSIGWRGYLIAVPLFGGAVSLGVGLYLRKRSKCPRCGKPWAKEVLRKEKRDAFYKDIPFDGLPPVVHVQYRVHQRCKYCGHRWISTQAERPWKSLF
jgi:hypothetical protein